LDLKPEHIKGCCDGVIPVQKPDAWGRCDPSGAIKWRAHTDCRGRTAVTFHLQEPDLGLRGPKRAPSANAPLDVGQTQRACNVHFGWPVVFAMSTARARNLTNVRSVSTLQARMSGGIL